jgi:hypothetical protein
MEMNLKIRPIQNAGEYERERVVIRATKDVDIGDYAVFMAKTFEDSVQSGSLQAFWLPDQKIISGDFVVIYTKRGVRSEKKNEEGRTSYFFYWGLPEAQWQNGMTPVLVQASIWVMPESKLE